MRRVSRHTNGIRVLDIADIRTRGLVPIVVGGSGLYVRAALDRLEIPPTDPELRAGLEAELAEHGVNDLRDRLVRLDPVAAAAIQPNNGRRIVRALEVIELTGRPFSATMPTREHLEPTVLLGLTADRPVLDARIDQRVARMWREGLVDEAARLVSAGLREGRTSSKALGYRQALAQLDGTMTAQEAQLDTATATRRYARRQESWFRADPRVVWLAHDAPDLVDQALDAVRAAGRMPP